jgi:hypothetical protein
MYLIELMLIPKHYSHLMTIALNILLLVGVQFGRFAVHACLAYTAIISQYYLVMLAKNTFPESA